MLEMLTKCNLCGSGNIFVADQECNICQCHDCGYVFDNPRPSWGAICAYYSRDNQYDQWLAQERGMDALGLRRLEEVLRYKQSGVLLDVGTGIGQFLSFARKYFAVQGTEISETAIRIAKSRYGLDVAKVDVTNVNWESRFDCITLFHVLEYVPDPGATIKKCYELLKPGGVLVIAAPNEIFGVRFIAVRILSWMKIGRFKNYGPFGLPKLALDGSQYEIHLSHFTSRTLRKALQANGLTVCEETLDPFYVAEGWMEIMHRMLYFTCRFIYAMFSVNIYAGIWLVARKA